LGEDAQKEKLDRMYQTAVSDYDAQRYLKAKAELEELLPYAPKSFELHELLGMTLASLSETGEAIEHLKLAVQSKPDSAEARINLGTILFHAGQTAEAGQQFQAALKLAPGNFDANHNLGELLVREGRIADALPLLERARQIDPNAYDNGYDLALAEFEVNKLDEARQTIAALEQRADKAELHNLLAQIDERSGDFVGAAQQYETAAHMDPSEENLFDWGGEMLLHRTYEAAIAIYQEGVRRYPDSPRLSIGLGLALYSRGKYDDAVDALLKAADLSPSDSRCYLFLSKAYNSSPLQANAVLDRFRRYAALKPNDALAQYYYAVSLWKGNRAGDSGVDLTVVERLLKNAIALDPTLADAHLQLGTLYSSERNYQQSIPEYERTLDLNPNLSDAHYRLGTDLVHVGEKERAQKEFEIYQRLRAEHLAEVEKERAEVRQFVIEAGGPGSTKP
jgi:tetratricopeptide (TPR) repeat protein